MLLKHITLMTVIGAAIAASGSMAVAQLNRSTTSGTLPNQMPCAPAGMMGQGRMMYGQIASEQAYLLEMIPHHQEAIATAKLVLERSDRPEMKAFAQDIIRVQGDEIRQMQAWLKAWYPNQQPAPVYHNMMRDLTQLQGNELDQAFLEDMIIHHMAAVRMSHQLVNHNLIQHDPLRPFAMRIASSQMQEIHQMQAWLSDWFGTRARMGGNPGRNGMGGMNGYGWDGHMRRLNPNR